LFDFVIIGYRSVFELGFEDIVSRTVFELGFEDIVSRTVFELGFEDIGSRTVFELGFEDIGSRTGFCIPSQVKIKYSVNMFKSIEYVNDDYLETWFSILIGIYPQEKQNLETGF
jgi:hypothetical protein